jgi:putative flippase GtrA
LVKASNLRLRVSIMHNQSQAAARQRITRFLVTGTGTAAIFFAVSYLLVVGGMSPFQGSALAYAIAFAIGYIGQRNWTFEARHQHRKSLPRYLVLQLACGTISSFLAQASVDYLGLTPFFMSLFVTAVLGVVSYIASMLWVFPVGRSA